jgi:predicted outer membrane protein
MATTPVVLCAVAALLVVGVIGCAPRNEEPASTPLPTRQTTIDPVTKKLEAAQQDTERRRAEVDSAAR